MSLIFSLQSHKLAKGRKLGECEQFPDVHFFKISTILDYFLFTRIISLTRLCAPHRLVDSLSLSEIS